MNIQLSSIVRWYNLLQKASATQQHTSPLDHPVTHCQAGEGAHTLNTMPAPRHHKRTVHACHASKTSLEIAQAAVLQPMKKLSEPAALWARGHLPNKLNCCYVGSAEHNSTFAKMPTTTGVMSSSSQQQAAHLHKQQRHMA
jgi:hypothetical protein